jgi:hypothetical protein
MALNIGIADSKLARRNNMYQHLFNKDQQDALFFLNSF